MMLQATPSRVARLQPALRSPLLRFRLRATVLPVSTLCAPRRCYAHQAETADEARPRSKSLLVSSEARVNDVGVQQLSAHAHSQIFSSEAEAPPKELVDLAIDHLTRHDLFGKHQDSSPPISFDMPPLHSDKKNLDEHFYKLGMDSAHPYLEMANRFVQQEPPERPQWIRQSGWTKYVDGTAVRVDAPDEELLTFDVEVMWKETSYACMACAVSPTAWYAWISPWLLGESETDRHLIPLGDPTKPRIIVGHNIGYDRARIAEEYDLRQSKNFFMDTMSLHVAVNGMCSRQRPKWMKHRKEKELRDKIAASDENVDLNALLQSGQLSDEEEELWIGRSSINSLRDVAKFHCNITIEKAQREYFGELDREGVKEKLDELLDYCAADVQITHRVYQKVFPLFHELCPHPVSFAALRFMGTEILPINESWNDYIKNAEETYQNLSEQVQHRLLNLAETALEIKDEPEKYEADPWMSQLNWSGQEIKYVKGKKKNDPPRPAARQKKPGMPKWYKDLFPKSTGPISLTTRTRIAPLLLRLSWDGHPLFWTDKYGWTYRVPVEGTELSDEMKAALCDFSEDENTTLRLDREHHYLKIPHKDGPQARCTNPLAKSYQQYFENGRLTSQYTYAKEALEMNASCSYWISARDRIRSQMAVFEGEALVNKKPQKDSQFENDGSSPRLGYILPQVIPMGTITRRAVENTWLTASNAKKNRVGSELKSMVKAPPGYCFVGADVDSEELWIASLIGDAQFKLHGGNAIGFMTLEGDKAAGTDLHSRTASILDISRNDAKVFNYGRIYGAGLKFASTLLRQFNPSLTEAQTTETASRLYQETKGKKTVRRIFQERAFWRGGTESFVFNKLEDFAEQEKPQTPVLGAGITQALTKRYLSRGSSFITSRINWAIQSSGVDYLHLLIVAMDYLIRRFNIHARLALTVHDEIRYLVKDEDKYRTAMALQVANLWTRAMFSQQVGIQDLPQACAFFSAVDIDSVLRKEVDLNCVTPSHPTPIPPGESLDILTLLEKGDEARLDPTKEPTPGDAPDPEAFPYEKREPVMASLQSTTNIPFLRAQITADDKELLEIVKSARPKKEELSGPSSSTTPKRSTADSPSAWRQARKNVPKPPHAQRQAVVLPFEHDDRAWFRNLERSKSNWKPAHQPHGAAGGWRSWGRV
ncbi:DNA polymerase gamma [Lasiodiplodia theobromae]|uniref:DNA polymerase gamma n=1 Tax=Lasiodiplodia theobromae TaxID=45133 RepID=UPI0015C2C26D|nr:DNA polymerase gamma [Lasiodiplodia theobromae]KAF4538651.1 DNA polymerase gamma [Lasiodiplodia theobromae]